MKLYKFTLFLFSIMPLVDTLNGYGISNKMPIIQESGVLYRIFIIVFCIYYILKLNPKKYLILSSMIFFVSLSCIHYFQHQNVNGLMFDLTKSIKLILVVIIPIFFMSLIKYQNKYKTLVKEIFSCLILIFPITLIIPYFWGIGNSIYANGAGYKGFYYSNNDLSIVLLVIVIFALGNLINNVSSKNCILLLLNVFCLLLMATKTSIIGLFIVFILYINDILKLIIKDKKILLYILLFSLGMFLLKESIISELLLTMERNRYLTQTGMDDITFLLGGRNKFFIERINQTSLLSFLFGRGEYYISIINRKSLIEMDLIDTYYIYGIFITSFVYFGFIQKFIKYLVFSQCNRIEKKTFIIAFIIMTMFSLLAGHVLYSALSGTVYALILSQFSLNRDKKLYIKDEYHENINNCSVLPTLSKCSNTKNK
ncbi:O-antigen ligase family protein [Turicibacter sanguinis]|uniref:O-antigen ligase family protein n=1 Tax=Turicibacter sanguinis TaxID=154288 RepID=UPI0018AC3BB1|nr:O-antigen ligase family protein [Turicibacter sanguinis]MDB8551634.1 O-antigen ligase family protein [Turicibacter sanguinis]